MCYTTNKPKEEMIMLKTETVRARVHPVLKHHVESILNKLGLSISDAIVLYMSQIKLNNGLPFDVRIPNKITRKALDEADQGKNLRKAKNIKDLFKQLDQ